MKRIIFKTMMEGLSVERAVRDSEFNMGVKHWHPECEIQYILEGTRCFFIDDQTYNVGKGSLVMIDSEQIHRTTAHKEFYHDRILLLVEKDKFVEKNKVLGFDLIQFFMRYKGVIQIPRNDQKRLERLMTEIYTEIEKQKEGFETMVQIRLLELWLYIIRIKQNGIHIGECIDSNTGKHQVVYEVVNYIKHHYNHAKSLDDIACKFYVDKCYLSRIFKCITGFTVNEYINIQRIRQSQKLLEETDYSIKTIAEMVGYDNVTYFTKVFKKYIETTPSGFRKKKIAYRQSIREKSGE